jgi:cell division protein FtsN
LDEQKSTSTRSRKAWGATLLLMCLLALVLGVFGAVYFERHEPGSPQVASNQPTTTGPVTPAPVAQPPAATPPPENKPATQAVPPPESAPPQTAQNPAPPTAAPNTTAQQLDHISPSAAPANVGSAAPRYWVEFGAYEGSFYADRLKQTLNQLGIAATVTAAPGAHGQRYLRVRGADQSDRTAAQAELAKAKTALGIAPLLHRVAAVSPGATRAAAAAPSGNHWVQFGAFRSRGTADKMLASLHKSDIQASVIKIKIGSGSSLYLVRVSGLADRAAAAHIAQQGTAALHSKDVLIGESLRARPPPQ